MAAVGYLLETAANQDPWSSQHNPQHYCFYTASSSKWWMVTQTASADVANNRDDFHLYLWDGTTPGSPGSAGGFALANASSNGDADGKVQIDDRDTGLPDLWWDEANQKLHVHSWHSTPKYGVLTYSSALNNWAVGWVPPLSSGGQSSGVAGTMPSGGFAVDSNGVVWCVFYATLTLQTRYLSGGTWTAGPTIESVAIITRGDSRVAVGTATIGGVASVYCAYSYSTGVGGVGEWRFAYRADSAALGAAWTQETIDTTQQIDDHISVASVVQSGNSNSTIVVIGKDDANDILGWTRNASGTWAAVVKVATTITRPRAVIDASNEVVYVFFTNGSGDDDTINYVTSPLPTLSWSAAAIAIDNGTAVADLNDAITPNHTCTYLTDLMMGCTQNSIGVWWKLFDLLIPLPATPTLATPADAAVSQAVNPTLSWNAATYATTYDLQVATDAGFASLVVNQTGIAATSYAVSGLSNNVTYYWKVRGVNATGNGSYSTARTFTTVMLSASKRRRVMLGVG